MGLSSGSLDQIWIAGSDLAVAANIAGVTLPWHDKFMEWLYTAENGLKLLVDLAKFVLETISVFCVLFGVVKTGQLAIKFSQFQYDEFLFIELRIRFGVWLALALEFQLGADILATTVAPTEETLIRLGVIALIRTFLNYFLNKELEKEFDFKKNHVE
ncbi:DUF1622 domain-containing protein [Arthrospira platensis]|uniref:DUF1622 domain-containing protein n=1 Tax=Limnospira TaxID=2596745 RepID=UPI0001C38EEB|nr:DUF1622 domain-containing protein [Arthrospira platensis NCB002]MDT9183895.1 DUF1622 domain-containing protein [Limnospira sp. PMC 289.06]MDT9296141.1 DUF1622 domain-containing protein [Arthrospira platensis PCC 7345]MDT9309386.1 DUF1622 domain-containing protein [Limnospira sp. Paracas R14]QQW32015.2 DUF1622 domain-containing protein [Arthrospira sp. PCC 9108]BAI90505.1 hypothetical protein NIES39_E02780 [Arthrospira platensis NIES-39]